MFTEKENTHGKIGLALKKQMSLRSFFPQKNKREKAVAIFNFVFKGLVQLKTKLKIATDNNFFIFYRNYLCNDICFILNANKQRL